MFAKVLAVAEFKEVYVIILGMILEYIEFNY